MIINKGNNTPVFPGANFTQDEIYRAHFGTIGDSFEFSDITLRGAQIIRSFYGIPLVVSASYRTPQHDISKGRSGTGTHTRKLAIDLDPKGSKADDMLYDYHKQILTKGPLYHELRKAGITGLGLYDGFIHIDSRPEGGKQKDEYGTYAFWDNRIEKKKAYQR